MTQDELRQQMVNFFTPSSQAEEDNKKYSSTLPGSAIPDYEKFDIEAKGLDRNQLPYPAFSDDFSKRMDQWLNQDPNFLMQDYLAGGHAAININSKSREETLKASRLADSLNNRYYRTPHTASFGAARYGGGGGVQGTYGELYKMPIETEEMRQMERMRQYEAITRAREIGRQQTALDTATIDKMAAEYKEELRKNTRYNDAQIDQMVELWKQELEYHIMRRKTQFDRSEYAFKRRLDALQIPEAQANAVMRLAQGDNIKMNILAVLFGVGQGGPTQQQILNTKAEADLIESRQRQGYGNDEIMQELLRRNIGIISQSMASVLGKTKEEAQKWLTNRYNL